MKHRWARDFVTASVASCLGALIGVAGTLAVTNQQQRSEQLAAAPDLALSCSAVWPKSFAHSSTKLLAIRVTPGLYRPGRYNNGAIFTKAAASQVSNWPGQVMSCVLRNDGDQVARQITLRMRMWLNLLHNGKPATIGKVPFVVSFDELTEHSEKDFVIASLYPSTATLAVTSEISYQAKGELKPSTHSLTITNVDSSLNPCLKKNEVDC